MLIATSEQVLNPNVDCYHKGIVVDNNDPRKAGRVRALVEGRLTVPESAYSTLPWIRPDSAAGEGGGRTDSGPFSVPNIGAEIKVRFIQDDPYNPVFTNAFQSVDQHTSALFNKNYPTVEGKVNSIGQWERTDKTADTVENFRGSVGELVSKDAHGNWTINIPGNLLVKVGGGVNIQVTQDTLFNLLGALNIQVGALAINSTADINMKASGNINQDATMMNTQSGAANVTAVSTAVSDLSTQLNTLTNTLSTLTSLSKSITTRGQTFNRMPVQQGISDTPVVSPAVSAINKMPASAAVQAITSKVALLSQTTLGIQNSAATVNSIMTDTATLTTLNGSISGAGTTVALDTHTVTTGMAALDQQFTQIGPNILTVTPATWAAVQANMNLVQGGMNNLTAVANLQAGITQIQVNIVGYNATLASLQATPGFSPSIISCLTGQIAALTAACLAAQAAYNALGITQSVLNQIATFTTLLSGYTLTLSICQSGLDVVGQIATLAETVGACSLNADMSMYDLDTLNTQATDLTNVTSQF